MEDSQDSFFRATAKLIGQMKGLESLEINCLIRHVRLVRTVPTEFAQAIQLLDSSLIPKHLDGGQSKSVD